MSEQSFAFGPFRLEAAGLWWREGLLVPLGRRGLLLLETLLRRRGEVVSKAELIDAAWPNEAVEESNLPVQMAKLRKAVGSDVIRTVERVGYQFVDLADAVPASPMRKGNIDRHFVECVMRGDETAAVIELVKAHRVTSVVGPGGVGKTTLALAVAKDLEPSFRDGVWVVDLATLTNTTTLESLVSEVLGIATSADSSQRETIIGELRDKSVLLVLDNCEHLGDAIVSLLAAILAVGPEVRVLLTTQVPLGIASEHLFKLAPFDLGGTDRDSPAVRFVAHCYAAQGEKLDDSERVVVERICRAFDGLALPLKLAASQGAIMGLAAVEGQLHRGPDKAAPGRGSLRGSMEWSYGLLTDDGRRVFRTLGVFQGSFSPAAVGEVGGLGADAALKDLVRRSIVVRDGAGGRRYRLLEPFRLFALELLGAAGEEEEARRRHAAFVSALFRHGLDLWETVPDDEWMELHRPDGANLRSALDWAERKPDWRQFAALTAASHRYYFQLGLLHEAHMRCETALVSTPAMDDETRAVMTVGAAEYVGWQTSALARLLDLDWAIAQLAEDRVRHFRVLALLLKGEALEVADKPQLARPLFEEADALVATMPDSKLKARTLVADGMSRWTAGDRDIGRAKIDAGLAMHAAFRNPSGLAHSAISAAEDMYRDGETDEAITLCKQTLPYFREHVGNLERLVHLNNLTSYLLAAGRLDDARGCIDEALPMTIDAELMAVLYFVQSAAEVAVLEGDSARAAFLIGYVDHGLASYSIGRQITEQRQLERIVTRLTTKGLETEKLARLRGQGAKMSSFEAQRLAGIAWRIVINPQASATSA